MTDDPDSPDREDDFRPEEPELVGAPYEGPDDSILLRQSSDFIERTATGGVAVSSIGNEYVFVDFLKFQGLVRADNEGRLQGLNGSSVSDIRVTMNINVAKLLYNAIGERLMAMGVDLEEPEQGESQEEQ